LLFDPGQQFYCAGLYWLFGPHPLHVIFFGIAYSSLAVLVAYLLIRRLGADVFGCRMGALAVALWPSFVLWSTQMLKEPLMVLAILLSLWLIMEIWDAASTNNRGRIGGWILLPGVIGLIAYFRFYVAGILFACTTMVFFASALVHVPRKPAQALRELTIIIVIGISTYLGSADRIHSLLSLQGQRLYFGKSSVVKMKQFKEVQQEGSLIQHDTEEIGSGAKQISNLTDQVRMLANAAETVITKIRSGYIGDGGTLLPTVTLSDKPAPESSNKSVWKDVPAALFSAMLSPTPKDWFSRTGDTKGFRQFAIFDMALIYILVLPALVIGAAGLQHGSYPVLKFFVLAFSLVLAIGIGLAVPNLGTLFRLRLQFLLPMIVLASALVRQRTH
ncbi:MAG: glycosyltransferase family 39 protein, partial [Anaerolineae bacterium]|nr:glycosyltransferase family 39 protein [Anaerolineae bacterium]